MDQEATGLGDIYSAIQAGSSVIAILAGFGYVAVQRWLDRRDAAVAAIRLARHSVDFVTERLGALTEPNNRQQFALRGARASEMIEVFGQLEISKLPPNIIESIAIIRSAVHAINIRINEVLHDDATRRNERQTRLYSAARTLEEVRSEYESLQREFACWNRPKLNPLSDTMIQFLKEAKRA